MRGIGATIGALLAAWGCSMVARTDRTQPNILWIITDDQRADSLACYNMAVDGRPESRLGRVSSPSVDRFASEGVLFTRAYCNSPSCAPSRASMHTGRYPHRSGIYGSERSHQMAGPARPTVPQILRRNGYSTVRFGKGGYHIFEWGPGLTWRSAKLYDVEFRTLNLQRAGLTDYVVDTPRQKVGQKHRRVGIEESWIYPDGTVKRFFVSRRVGRISDEDRRTRSEVEHELDILRAYSRSNSTLIIGGRSPQPADKTNDSQIVSAFEHFLRNRGRVYTTAWGRQMQGAAADKPLFVHIGLHVPHTPVLPPREFRDRFSGETYRVPEFSTRELKRLPPQLVQLHQEMDFHSLRDEDKQQAIRDYYAFCAFGDHLIGRAVSSFKEFSRRTGRGYLIVFVCGDQGWHLGEQGIEAKFGPYDASNHGAVVVASSDRRRFPPGRTHDGFVEYVDLAPTFLQAAGVDTRQQEYGFLDGYPLGDILHGRAVQREYVLGEMNHVYGPRAYLRSRDFAFSMRVRPDEHSRGADRTHVGKNSWALDAPREDVELALFDLRVDPGERWNVADHGPYVELADFLREKLGRIVLGDGRVECDWRNEDDCTISDFARGADDKRMAIPDHIVPAPSLPPDAERAHEPVIDTHTPGIGGEPLVLGIGEAR